jgi:hypothetical protein
MLAGTGKKNLRVLSSAEANTLEDLKFRTLCNTTPFGSFTMGQGGDTHPLPDDFEEVESIYKGLVAAYTERRGTAPSIDERRDMQASAYAAYHSGDEEDGV